MRRVGFSGFTDILIAALCILFAIAFQIQITLFASPTYLGLRISMADLLTPFAATAILFSLLKHQSLWPVWPVKNFYGWLAALTILLFAALIHTHFTFGEISNWAMVNKFGGWIVLMGLLGCGAWIGMNARQKHIELFLKTALYFMFAVVIFDLIVMVAWSYPAIRPYIGIQVHAGHPIDGLMANRNIYGLFYIAIACFTTCLHLSDSPVIRPWYAISLYFLMPFFAAFNGSRAMFLALCITTPFLFIHYRAQKRQIAILIAAFIVGVTLLTSLFQNKTNYIYASNGRQFEFLEYVDETIEGPESVPGRDVLTYSGDTMRLTILADAKELIAQRPILGSGLGSMLLFQQKKNGKLINVIDCTPLWLLVETGLIGLVTFIAFYFKTAQALISRCKQDEGLSNTFRTALLGILIGFTLMSLFHELLYTRFIWFFLGLGLTLPSRMRQGE